MSEDLSFKKKRERNVTVGNVALVLFFIGLLVFGFKGQIDLSNNSVKETIIVFFWLFVSLFCFIIGLRELYLAKRIKKMPFTNLSEITTPGFYKVTGAILEYEGSTRIPGLIDEPSVLCRVLLEKIYRQFKTTTKTTVINRNKYFKFIIQDATGEILVNPLEANVRVSEKIKKNRIGYNNLPEVIKNEIKEDTRLTKMFNKIYYDFSIINLAVKQKVIILGEVVDRISDNQQNITGPRFVFEKTKKRELIIADENTGLNLAISYIVFLVLSVIFMIVFVYNLLDWL